MNAQQLQTETSLEMKRVFAAPLALCYRAWTDPALMNGWFHPDPNMHSECTVDLRVNGAYQVRMYPPAGEPYLVGGVYQEIVPQQKLVFTWRWVGEQYDDGESVVTILFRAVGDAATEVTLRHEQLATTVSRDNHAQGWEGVLAQLAAALA